MRRGFILMTMIACSSSEPEPESRVAEAPTSIELREMRRLPTRARMLTGAGSEILVGAEGEVLRVLDGEVVERLNRPAYRGGALVEAGPLVAWPTWSRGDEVRELGEAGTRLLDSIADARAVFELRERGEDRAVRRYDLRDPETVQVLAEGPRVDGPLALSDAWLAFVAGSVRVIDRNTGGEKALLSTGDRYAVRALAFDGDELLGIDARGVLTRWRLDQPERTQETIDIADPRRLIVTHDTLVVVGRRSVWLRRGERTGTLALEEGQIESALAFDDTLVLGIRARPSHVRWLRIE